ncbi:MAG: hypothetical protein ACRDZQ_12450 [Acidimicrobiales bacterium]
MGDPDAPPLQARELFQLLGRHGVRYVVVGGLAATVHGAGRATFDIDLVPEWTSANLEHLAEALRAAHARLRVPGSAEPVAYPIDERSLRGFEVSTWRTDHGDVDVIVGTPTADRQHLARYEDLAARAQSREAFGVTIQVADLGDVIESKQALARDPDLAALPELHRLWDRLHRS